MIFINGDRISLNVLNAENICDGDKYPIWLNSQEGDEFTGHARFPNDLKSIQSYVQRANQEKDRILLGIVLKSTGAHIGNIELRKIDFINRNCEVAILVGEESQRDKGYGSEALRLLLRHAFFKLSMHRVYLGVNTENVRAIRCYEKLGFDIEGIAKDAVLVGGRYADVALMAVMASRFS